MLLGTWLEMHSWKEVCHAEVRRDISKGTAAHKRPTLGQQKTCKTQETEDKNKKPGAAERSHDMMDFNPPAMPVASPKELG